jgi:hypothetical protein
MQGVVAIGRINPDRIRLESRAIRRESFFIANHSTWLAIEGRFNQQSAYLGGVWHETS